MTSQYLSPRAATILISSMRKSWTLVAGVALGGRAGQPVILDTVVAEITAAYPNSTNLTKNISMVV